MQLSIFAYQQKLGAFSLFCDKKNCAVLTDSFYMISNLKIYVKQKFK